MITHGLTHDKHPHELDGRKEKERMDQGASRMADRSIKYYKQGWTGGPELLAGRNLQAGSAFLMPIRATAFRKQSSW